MRVSLRLYALCLIGCLWHTRAAGQSDSLQGETWLKNFEAEQAGGQSAAALHSIDQAIAAFRRADVLDRWLLCQRQKAPLLVSQEGQPFTALAYIDSCLSLVPQWRMPGNKEEHRRYCRFLLIKSYIAKQYAEDYVTVKTVLEEAYQGFLRDLEDDTAIAKYLYFQLGNACVRLGEFESAEQIFQEAHAYSLRHEVPAVAKFSDHAGLHLQRGDYTEARRIFLEGLNTPDLPEEDLIFTKLGYVEYLIRTSDYEQAIRESQAIETQLDQLQTPEARQKLPEFRQSLFENYGQIYFSQGNCAAAQVWYKRSLETEQGYQLSSRRKMAFLYNEIGNIAMTCGDTESALIAFQQALQTMIPGFVAPEDQNPPAAGFTAENVIYKALYGKAQCFEKMGRLPLALECYELIPIVEAKLRATHEYESSTLQALEDSRLRLDKAVGIAWQLYETTRDEQLAARAFHLTEQIRGVVLLKNLAKAQQNRTLPDSTRQQYTALQAKIAWYERKIAEGKMNNTGPEQMQALESGLFQTKQELTALEASAPGFTRLDEQIPYLSAGKTPALLHPGTLMVSYYFVDSALYIFSCSPQRFLGWRKVPAGAAWRERVSQFTQYLTRYDPNEPASGRQRFIKTAVALYTDLLAPELKGKAEIRSLIIVPDDLLSYLPFEVLLPNAPTNGLWATLPYLVNRYSVAYSYSATLLAVQQSIERPYDKQPPFAAFTPTYERQAVDPVSGFALNDLSQIQVAAENSARKFGGVVFTHDANEARFKQEAAQYSILVLGMHGFADLDNPALARLIIGTPHANQEQDNVLYVSELQIMRLRAALVVLLACHTGNGQWRKGEGVYSLARAFTMASVPTTVMSLWSLPDAAASPLTEVFFEKIGQRAPTDVALQEAKRAYLNNPDYFDLSHPFFWAGLMAMGNMQPVVAERQ